MPPNKDADLLQGTLDMMILKTLTRGPLHGYDVAEAIHLASDEVLQVDEGALYPALHRLQLKGFLDAEWGVSENNRRAKFYRLTDTGREHLVSESRRWRRLAGAVSRVMRTA